MNQRHFIVGVFAGILVLVSQSVWALSVTPGRTQIMLPPGGKMNAMITVSNDEKIPLNIELSNKDWFVLPENKDFPVSTWMKLHGKKKFRLESGQSRQVKVTVKAPKGAQGELVGMASFRYTTDEYSMVTPMISVSIYAGIDGTEKVAGEIRGVAGNVWQDKLQLAVSLRTTGNVHLRPQGSIELVSSTGAVVVNCPVKEGDPTYPGADRAYFCAPLDLKLTPGTYQVKAHLQYRTWSDKIEGQLKVASDGKITEVTR